MIQLTKLYHKIIKQKKDIHIAVDMTCGHGYDTLFLASVADKVYGFDIQSSAIEETKYRLKDYQNIQLFNEDHQYIDKYIKEKIDMAIFNLGYMPGGDLSISTQTDSTLIGLQKLIKMLNHQGMIILELYPHNQNEVNTLMAYATMLDNQLDVLDINLTNKENAPKLLIIQKP